MTEKKVFTPAEIAEALGVHLNTVYKYIHEGKIETVKIGARQYRITAETLQKILQHGLQ